METVTNWKYLVRKPKSNYQQLFIKDRWIAARTLYGQSLGEDAQTPDQLAADFRLPLEAVLEAIAYSKSDPSEVREDWRREQTADDLNGINHLQRLLATPPVSLVASGSE